MIRYVEESFYLILGGRVWGLVLDDGRAALRVWEKGQYYIYLFSCHEELQKWIDDKS